MSETPSSCSGSAPAPYAASDSFRQWELAAGIYGEARASVPKFYQNVFRQILECNVPKELHELTPRTCLDIEREMLQDTRGLPSKMLSDDDPHGVCSVWGNLCLIRQILEKSKATEDDVNEASKGFIPTLLLQLVFARHGDQRQVRQQEILRLPRPRGDMTSALTTIPSPSPIADLIVTSLSATIPSDVQDCPFHKQLAWQDTPPIGNVSVIIFLVECKSGIPRENTHQLLMHLATAQRQRRALRLADSAIYGATYITGEFRVFASYWKNQTIRWSLIDVFWLVSTKDLLRCYSCLCQIASDAKPLHHMLRSLSSNDLQNSDHQNNNTWRASMDGAPHMIELNSGKTSKDESIKAWLTTLEPSEPSCTAL